MHASTHAHGFIASCPGDLGQLSQVLFLVAKEAETVKGDTDSGLQETVEGDSGLKRLLRVTLTVDSKRHKGDTNSGLQETVKADSALQET